jgi:hypothetical protein
MTDPRHSSSTNEWFTPIKLVELCTEVFGTIDLDPASCLAANEIVKANKIYTKEQDGLSLDWSGNVFLNPPGEEKGQLIKKFWGKAVTHASRGEASVIWIGFNSNQLYTLQEFTDNPLRFPTCFPKKRIRFKPDQPRYYPDNYKVVRLRGKKRPDSPSHHNYVTILSRNAELISKFRSVFSKLGTVIG